MGMLKLKLTQKFIGHQVAALKCSIAQLAAPDSKLNKMEMKVKVQKLTEEIRSRYVDLDVVALLIACLEDVPQATIVMIVVSSTGDWSTVAIFTIAFSLSSLLWRAGQVFASKCGCKDPSGLIAPRFSMPMIPRNHILVLQSENEEQMGAETDVNEGL